jgi:imidazole glycerol phosphate synthase subunit HisF
VSSAVPIPVIARAAPGRSSISATSSRDGQTDAALAASVFHFSEHAVSG